MSYLTCFSTLSPAAVQVLINLSMCMQMTSCGFVLDKYYV